MSPTKRLLRALASIALALACSLGIAQTQEQLQQLLKDQEYCYGLSAMARMTVVQRNAGSSLEEQMARRQTSLGADSNEYKLVESVAQQIYDKDLRDPLPVAADAHRACLQGKGLVPSFTERAVRNCPAVGFMVSEVAAARLRGATVEQVKALIGDRYGALAQRYEGGVEKLAAKYNEASKPDAGNTDYTMCMILGMTGVLRR